VGYKLLGYVVWRGAKWYLRRRYGGVGRKLAVAAGAGLLLGGAAAAVAARRSSRR
jgi:hypothetical protein